MPNYQYLEKVIQINTPGMRVTIVIPSLAIQATSELEPDIVTTDLESDILTTWIYHTK